MCFYCHSQGHNLAAPSHRSKNCRDPNNEYSNYHVLPPAVVCTKSHNSHYCKVCSVFDSNHQSSTFSTHTMFPMIHIFPPAGLLRTEYWGRAGAGLFFHCKEDKTVLLLLRSGKCQSPNTYGIPGGAIRPFHGGKEQMWYPPISKPMPDNSRFWDTAHTEVTEECGRVPPNFGENAVYRSALFEDRGFYYKTFMYAISKNDKNNWVIDLNHESVSSQWFSIPEAKKIPNPHHGIIDILANMH